MSLDTILPSSEFPVLEDDFSYNVKWTLLMHVRQIVKSDTFKKEFEKDLPDSSFIDSTPLLFGADPIFGVEYMGMREGSSELQAAPGGLYVVGFRGMSMLIEAVNEFGIDSRNRRLLFLHDSIITTLKNRSDAPGMALYNFRNKDNPPTKLGKTFSLTLVESTFPLQESTGGRLEGFDLVYFIEER